MRSSWQAVVALGSAALGFGLGFLAASPPPSNPPVRSAALGKPPAPGTPGAAVYDALLIRDPLARTAALVQLLGSLGPDDLQHIRAAYDNVVTAPADPEIALLAQWWAQHDPEGAYTWARFNQTAHHPTVISAVLRTWARQDPHAANRALVRLRDPEQRRHAMVATVLGWEDGGYTDLPAFLGQLPQGIDLQRTVDALARRMVLRRGTAEAFRWAESLPPDASAGRLKVNAIRRVAGAVAELDPATAMAFAEKHGEDPAGRNVYARVGSTVAQYDGELAMQWLGTLPEGIERRNAVQETYREWLKQDRGAAMRWMRGQQTEPWLDPAIRLFAIAVSRTGDPEVGIAWAVRISPEGRRDDAILRVARMWLTADPVAAQAWIDGADIPEELKQRIVTLPPKRERKAAPKRAKKKRGPRKQQTPGPQGEAAAPVPDA